LHASSTILYKQSLSRCNRPIVFLTTRRLTLKGEGSTDLVASLVELGGVEGEAEAEGGAGVELSAVGKGGDTAVVDLDLLQFH
jgi:hypothetical protein